MIAFPLPHVDAALLVAMAISFFALLALALWVRPELRDGKKQSRMRSYAIGSGVLLGSILLLSTFRGVACDCWSTQIPQLWLDSAGLAAACVGATWIHRQAFGEPRHGIPWHDLHKLEQEAEAITRDATKS